jgi:hypothetical protein
MLHTFTLNEIAAMSGITPQAFRRMVEAGIVHAVPAGRSLQLDDHMVYSLVSAKHPSVVVGKTVWVTCGEHVQMCNPLELPDKCPGQPGYKRRQCGGRLRLATEAEVVAKVVTAKERKEALIAFRQPYACPEW